MTFGLCGSVRNGGFENSAVKIGFARILFIERCGIGAGGRMGIVALDGIPGNPGRVYLLVVNARVLGAWLCSTLTC